MDRSSHKKKSDSSTTSFDSSTSRSSHGDINIPPNAFQAVKTFERRVSADAAAVNSTNNLHTHNIISSGLPPKMSLPHAKSPEPIISEPGSPIVPLTKARFGSTDLLSSHANGRSSSPHVERKHHQSSSQSVTVHQSRQYQEIVDGKQVVNYSASRQNSHQKESKINSTEINGEVKVDADHKVSSSSAAKASIEALDSMGQSLRAACAALSHSSNATNSSYAGSHSGIGELTQTSKSETIGARAIQNPDGTVQSITYSNAGGGNPLPSQKRSISGLMEELRGTPSALENQVRSTLKQMVEMMEEQTTITPMLKNKLENDGVVDLLIENVDSQDQEVSMLSAKMLDKCMNTDARERLLKRGIDGIVRVATIKGNPESRRAGAGLLEKILNNSEAACTEVVNHGGLDAVLEACKSTDVETQRSSALALLNLSLYGGQFNQHRMIKQRAQDWLFPLAFGQQDQTTKYFACLCVGSLIANKELEAAVIKSGTLDLVNDFVTENSPEEFASKYAEQLDAKQSRDIIIRLMPILESRIAEAQQLAAFHFATEAYARKKRNELKIFREVGAVEHLKNCASSPNDVASRLAGEALAVLGEMIPHRLSQQVPLWTVPDVKQWLQQVGYSSVAKTFVEKEVDGDLLLQLTEQTLRDDLNMHSRILRQRFLRDLLQLKRISDYTSCDPFNIHSLLLQIGPEYAQYTYNLLKAGVDPSVFPFVNDDHLKNDAWIENGVHRAKILDAIGKRRSLEKGAVMEVRSENDVFISYRRATGSQLASLLKVHLQLRGFSVFIDIDKLDAGAFDQKLIDSVRLAKHFVLILSPNALDRCINDAERKDWIHREISAALSYKCNIVPITDPSFIWPNPDALPEDMRSVCKFNGIRWIHDYQDACVDKLERFLRGDLNLKAGHSPVATSQTGAGTAGQISSSSAQSPLPSSGTPALSYHGSAF
ncbi:NAD(+) hydrolase SARM1-like isoform X2 [Paramacrobiotus metropolitanus]|nr:NAD(+) hydrolase SARM1-like isoform X2 [Paramacrobiotus metropolitanus]